MQSVAINQIVKDCIAQGKIDNAFSELANFLKKQQLDDDYNILILIYARYERYNKNRLLGVDSHSDEEISINKINRDVLDLSSRITSKGIEKIEKIDDNDICGIWRGGNIDYNIEIVFNYDYTCDWSIEINKEGIRKDLQEDSKIKQKWLKDLLFDVVFNVSKGAIIVMGTVKGKWFFNGIDKLVLTPINTSNWLGSSIYRIGKHAEGNHEGDLIKKHTIEVNAKEYPYKFFLIDPAMGKPFEIKKI